jgi:hypothetical protein
MRERFIFRTEKNGTVDALPMLEALARMLFILESIYQGVEIEPISGFLKSLETLQYIDHG